MTGPDPRVSIILAFQRLRPNSVLLGMDELLAALKLLEGGFVAADQPEIILRYLKRIWCKTETDEWQLERIWTELLAGATPPPPRQERPPLDDVVPPISTPSIEQDKPEPQIVARSEQSAPQLKVAPFQPRIPLLSATSGVDLQTYWPVSRRFMTYMWRYMRRPIRSGIRDVFDLPRTIDEVSRNGFLFAPVYNRRVLNQARLIVLLDHRGSMMPFHRYLRDLVETLDESDIEPANRAVYYFENVPDSHVYQTPYLTQPIEWTHVRKRIDPTTGVLIVSDAGAARGRPRNRRRVQNTLAFLYDVRSLTRLVVWMNPMPSERWEDTTAEAIAASVPMFPMDEYGFSLAIDVLSGRVVLPSGDM